MHALFSVELGDELLEDIILLKNDLLDVTSKVPRRSLKFLKSALDESIYSLVDV